ncbi:MAG: phosphoribosylamine--glycine ligase [Dehalococcoidales bacterium]|nr:phosphoribosylamine--glycine ligase [Dehalococcoidales bacterium]
MKILVIGSGGREHTFVWKLAQSPKAGEIYVAPGNAGTAQIAQNVGNNPDNIGGLVKLTQEKGIEMVVVGPEVPLAEGIVDRFQTLGIPIFGPTKGAAQIESSKAFSKGLMLKYGIPCARSKSFSDYGQAADYVKGQAYPLWIKADGLAAGKGAIIAESLLQAQEILSDLMETKSLGTAGDTVIIEESMSGVEMSSFIFTDGLTVTPMADACDYKRINDGNEGPNTGGMGAYSPPRFYTPELGENVKETIMEPAVKAMNREKRLYKGILYGGLMITEDGPKVIEFNARLGDPEAQVVLPRLKTDLVDIMLAVIDGDLGRINVELSEEACIGVVMASGGYPGRYQTGFPISGLDDVDKEITVFHAGTRISPSGEVLTNGGRVLAVTAMGETLAEAREKVYANISRIHFKGCHYREDIGSIRE